VISPGQGKGGGRLFSKIKGGEGKTKKQQRPWPREGLKSSGKDRLPTTPNSGHSEKMGWGKMRRILGLS